MSAKRALIVDDSKTAQLRLRKMLDQYDLQIDLAGSAEEALSYLSYRNPSVIFLDHLMPGMDGFEALKVIKANPYTATIPVVMYTSKSGDLYMGQARALGAVDVLSKDEIEPSSIQKVMSAINVLPKVAVEPTPARHRDENVVSPVEEAALTERGSRPEQTDIAAAVPAAEPAPVSSPEHRSDPENLKRHLTRLLEMNTIKIRQEVSDQNRFMFKRMMRELKDIKTGRESQPPAPPIVVGPQRHEEKGRSIIPDLIIIAVLVFIGFQAHNILNGQADNEQQILALQSRLDERQADSRAVAGQNKNMQSAGDDEIKRKLFAAIEWSMNLNNQFDFGELALNDERLTVIQDLISRLHEAQFSGVVLLSVNHGDFCVVTTSNGDLVLPKPETSVQNCQLLSQQATEFAVQDQMSLAFVNFLLSSPLLSDQGIQIDLVSHGLDQPKFSYPEPTVSAGRWNQVARLNNRVDIELIPGKHGTRRL